MNQLMHYKFIENKIKYDGQQLRSLFGYMDHGLLGDSMVAFEGACDIPFDHMVDGEDVRANSAIRGGHMLHFIVEMFGKDLELAVATQRLLASLVFEELIKSNFNDGGKLKRDGDDVFVGDGKLSISIATVSPVSALIHFAMNVTNENTPVKTACLNDLGLEPRVFADRLALRFLNEIKTIREACCKVRWVR
jgi:uncharacterized protein